MLLSFFIAVEVKQKEVQWEMVNHRRLYFSVSYTEVQLYPSYVKVILIFKGILIWEISLVTYCNMTEQKMYQYQCNYISYVMRVYLQFI